MDNEAMMAESENPLAGEEGTTEEGPGDELAMGDEEMVLDQEEELLGEADHLGVQLGDESSPAAGEMVDDAGVEEALQAWEEGGPVLEEKEDADRVTAVRFAQLEEAVPQVDKKPDLLNNVFVDLLVELGRKQMSVTELTNLKEQEVIELDKLAGEAFDIRVNGRLFAKGEVVVVTDLMAVRITTLHQNPDTKRTEAE